MSSEDDDPLAIFAPKKPTPQRQAAQEKMNKAKNSLFGDNEVKRENPFVNTCQEVKNQDYIVPEQLEETEEQAEKSVEKVFTPEKPKEKPKDSNSVSNKSAAKTQSTLGVPENPTNLNQVKIQKNPSPKRDLGKNSLFGLDTSGQNSLSVIYFYNFHRRTHQYCKVQAKIINRIFRIQQMNNNH